MGKDIRNALTCADNAYQMETQGRAIEAAKEYEAAAELLGYSSLSVAYLWQACNCWRRALEYKMGEIV